MNWGHKIIIVFVLFAIGMMTLVIKSMRTRIDMVTADYYAEELKYQQTIDGQANVKRLSAPVAIAQREDSVELSFPGELHGRSLQGSVLFYRPSDSRKDVSMPLTLNDTGKIRISKHRFTKGNYRVKLQWEDEGKPYFQELQYQCR